ncbi:tyrosine-type recombinase/integrase [Marinobacter goseongensis]|uniref:tyrosine-type recombinase/integrase n=1 Tax=Marinobacter goseongensis TaxID=453838 RepID=UPI002002C595|nr:tyrosine-type recombinase/integrase [Marinobacter goseongensis]MCK7553401.1 tyrosine-type recombinase/integrase [Marinobacter goseongensis]
MDLFFSTSKFKLNGQSYSGFPILISKEGKVVEEALDFCMSYLIKRGRVQSRKSWVTYGKALYQFFGWCEENGIDWRDVGNDREATILAEFRDWNLSSEGGSLAAGTVNARLRLLCAFYRYAASSGWVATVPYAMETIKVSQPKGFLAHVDASGGMRTSADIMLKTPRTVIRLLSKHQSRDLLDALSNPTHRLIVRLALTTGMRREELATFPLKYVINPVTYTKHRSFIRVNLDPRDMTIKGNEPRGIDVPRTVMEDLWQYVLDRRHQHESISGRSQPVLFLTESGQPYANDGAAFLGIVKKAGKAAGIPYVNVHVLRHTYATHTLYAMMQAKAQTHALMYVRDRLGHASITTTEKYLHCISELEDVLMNDFQSEIDVMSRETAGA